MHFCHIAVEELADINRLKWFILKGLVCGLLFEDIVVGCKPSVIFTGHGMKEERMISRDILCLGINLVTYDGDILEGFRYIKYTGKVGALYFKDYFVASENGILGASALTLAILIGLHNIPEGMAVSVPLIAGGMKKWKSVLLTAASGIPTMIGALLGFLLGDLGALGLALSLGFASGAMLYVVFGEILPQAILLHHSKIPAFSVIAGMLVGILIIFG